MMARDTKNFKVSEFDCKNCTCGGLNGVKQKTIDCAQKIRDYIGKPMTITSGFRCDDKQAYLRKTNPNAAKGRSAHQDGLAFDFVISGMTAKDIGAKIKKMYQEGKLNELEYSYLITSTAVHVGVDHKPNRWRKFAY